MRSFLTSLATALALLTSVAVAVHHVEIQGQDFVDTVTKKRLMIIGVDYQPGGQAGYKPGLKQDPLSDGKVCLRDAALLQRLGVNTIRVYNIDPTLNHDECASIFNAVGIYMILDVNSPFESLHRDPGEVEGSYNAMLMQRIFGMVENFKGYPNTLAFFSANEVMNDISSSEGDNPRYVRAVQRDLKNYIDKHADRKIPVGYSAADVREILEDTWAYLQCDNGNNDQSRSDFFGLNSYSWCGGEATFQSARYNELVDMFQNSTIPVFFSEYGCNKVQPRVFSEVQALYGKEMTALSGGLVYEYSQEEADYGLVFINKNGTVTLREDFDNLQKQYNKLDLDLVQSTNPTATSLKPPKCDESLISDAGFSKDFDVPKICKDCQKLLDDGVKMYKGSLKQVKETNVAQAVYGTNGQEINGLSIRLLGNDESNLPGGETTNPSGTGGAEGPQESKKGAASLVGVSGVAVALGASVVGLVVL